MLNTGNQRTSQTRTGPGFTNTVDYGYDPLGQLLTATGKEVDGSTRLHEKFGYAYDAGGNLKTRTNNALIQSFTVNEVNQLTNVFRSGTLTVSGNTTAGATNVTVSVNGGSAVAAQRYADLTWALGGTTVATGSNTYTAIAQNVGSVFDTNTVAVFQPVRWQHQFDANGNLTVETSPLGGTNRCFAYDDENQLIAAWVTNVWKSEFVYDGLGRMRIKREYSWSPGSGVWVLGTDTRYIYDGMLVIQERGANTSLQVSYTRGKDLSGGMQGAGGIGGLLGRTDHTQTSVLLKTAFYHVDGNGNITALLSANGLVLAWYQYSPFGTTLAQSGPLADANVYRFSGKAWHERTGLYYYGYRFYSPNLQRWLNADPLQEAGGINLYLMAGNNTVDNFDSYGLARYEYDGQGIHVHDDGLDLTYRAEPGADGTYTCSAKPGHEKQFNMKAARDHLAEKLKNKKEFQKIQQAIADAHDKLNDKEGVATRGRNMRRLRGALLSLGILGYALALDPTNADAATRLNNARQSIEQSLKSGDCASDDDIDDIMLAVKDIYGDNTLATWYWERLHEKVGAGTENGGSKSGENKK